MEDLAGWFGILLICGFFVCIGIAIGHKIGEGHGRRIQYCSERNATFALDSLCLRADSTWKLPESLR